MGKLAVISDLHADINHFDEDQLSILRQVLADHSITRLHFAGDSANKIENTLAVNRFFRQMIPTTFNLGNHEMVSIHREEEIEHFPDPNFLNLSYRHLNSDTVLLGLNGWYDYQYAPDESVEEAITAKNLYWYDRNIKRGADDITINRLILQQLKQVLDELAKKDYRVVLATHFVPQREFIVTLTGKYQVWNKLNAFLGAPSLGELLDQYDNIEQVVFGHTHRRFPDKIIHQTRYSCRPVGYYYEWRLTKDFVLENELVEEYNPMKLRPIIRKHQAAFDTFKNQHLAEEFNQALTVISY